MKKIISILLVSLFILSAATVALSAGSITEDPKTNPDCFVGSRIQDTLNHFYTEIEAAAFQKMQAISLADVIHDLVTNEQK